MGLRYPGVLNCEGIGFGITSNAVDEFIDLLVKTADGSKRVIEDFKTIFGGSGSSTDIGFAVYDMSVLMRDKSSNAADFVDNIWKCIENADELGHVVPSQKVINEILTKHDIPLEVDPPELRRIEGDSVIVDAETTIEEDTAASTISKFVLGEEIGSGGYGVVYRATRRTVVSDFEYALKILDPSPFVEDYEKALRRFKREIRALQSLQHRSIVQYFEAGIDVNKKPYIVMPFIDGKDLRSATQATNLNGVLNMFVEILLALKYAHNNSVFHRDLKPNNIIVRKSDQQPIILDFGSAYILDQLDSESLTSMSTVTIGDIPSEIIADPKKRSPLHDVYSCGIMLYESFAHRLPDPANYKPLVEINEVYIDLDLIIEQAIAGESDRISTAGEFARQLIALDI